MAVPYDLPLHDQLSGDDDENGWDRTRHGKMADYADSGHTVDIITYADED